MDVVEGYGLLGPPHPAAATAAARGGRNDGLTRPLAPPDFVTVNVNVLTWKQVIWSSTVPYFIYIDDAS